MEQAEGFSPVCTHLTHHVCFLSKGKGLLTGMQPLTRLTFLAKIFSQTKQTGLFTSMTFFMINQAVLRFFTSVQSLVLYQVCLLSKPFLTYETSKRPFTGVHPFMFHQVHFLRKAFQTDTARIGPFTSVQFFVANKVCVLPKAFVADRTHIGFLSGVQSLMLHQVRLLNKRFLT